VEDDGIESGPTRCCRIRGEGFGSSNIFPRSSSKSTMRLLTRPPPERLQVGPKINIHENLFSTELKLSNVVFFSAVAECVGCFHL
jgi:hypothetical protein